VRMLINIRRHEGRNEDVDVENGKIEFVTKRKLVDMIVKFMEEVRAVINRWNQNPSLNDCSSHVTMYDHGEDEGLMGRRNVNHEIFCNL
jgi:hypothetical protein